MIHILIVDDDPHMRLALRVVLAQDARAIHEAHNGTEGLAYIFSNPPHIVFTDQMMSGHTGTELIKETLARRVTPEPSFIFTSATRALDEEVTQLATVYPLHILHKPFTIEAVETLVSTVIAEREPIQT
ncbi:MAG: response regulator [Ktedonobacterales bacterium]|nr:response regulator [Ktedonobacterales bacterium]